MKRKYIHLSLLTLWLLTVAATLLIAHRPSTADYEDLYQEASNIASKSDKYQKYIKTSNFLISAENPQLAIPYLESIVEMHSQDVMQGAMSETETYKSRILKLQLSYSDNCSINDWQKSQQLFRKGIEAHTQLNLSKAASIYSEVLGILEQC